MTLWTLSLFLLPLPEAVVEEEVGERVVEVLVVGADAVVLVGVGLLPEEDVLLLQGGRQQHGLLVVDVVVLGPVD